MIPSRLFSLLITLTLLLFPAAALAAPSTLEVETLPLNRNGVGLYLERIQSGGERGKGGQILLVHGLTSPSAAFNLEYKDYSLARFLAENGYAVWLLDIAGFGRSDQVKDGLAINTDYAVEDVNTAVDAIIAESGQTAIDILGWSWGTVIVGRFAAKYPQKVGKLILYGPVLSGLGGDAVSDEFSLKPWKPASGDFREDPQGKIDTQITEEEVAARFMELTARFYSRPVPNGGLKDLRVPKNIRLIPEERIQARTLLMLGSSDQYFSVEDAEGSLKRLPGQPELLVIEGGAHAMFLEKPYYKKFQQALLNFLKY